MKKVPITDRDGNLYLLALAQDITEACLSKTHIERLNRQLEEQLSLLNVLNQELESFAYSVSHDLRAPLRGIEGISQLVEKEYGHQLDDEGKKYLHILRHEAQRMSTLIETRNPPLGG